VCVDVLETFVLIILDELNKRAMQLVYTMKENGVGGYIYNIKRRKRNNYFFVSGFSSVASSSIDRKFMSVAINCISGGREQR
jgi:hypothetical protein